MENLIAPLRFIFRKPADNEAAISCGSLSGWMWTRFLFVLF